MISGVATSITARRIFSWTKGRVALLGDRSACNTLMLKYALCTFVSAELLLL